MKKTIFLLLGVAMFLCGCGGTGPQRPSQRKSAVPTVDSTQLALMELNYQLATAADEQLRALVKAQTENYALYNNGTWVHIIQVGETDRAMLKQGEECTVRMRVMSLEGKLYTDTEQTATIGKYEWPTAVDKNLPEWHHGARVKMFVPWYSAYGIKGTAEVPPYENVIIELDIE